MGDPKRIGQVVREAGWDPPDDQGAPPMETQGPTEADFPQGGMAIDDVMLVLAEHGAQLKRLIAGVNLIYQTVTKGWAPPQRQAPPPQARQEAPRSTGGQGGPPRQAYGQRPAPRQAPPRQADNRPAPGNGLPYAEERWFRADLLDQEIRFGKKWAGARWGDLLATDDGRQYLEWLVNSNVEQHGKNPNGWKGPIGRAALWLLSFGEKYANQGGDQQAENTGPVDESQMPF